jgi:putative transcriptional regulator
VSFGKDLVQSAQEALAIARGELEPGRVHVVEGVDAAAIRKRQKLTQAAFAARYGIPVATLRDWEQGRRSPDAASASFLRVIDREPEAVARALDA